MAGHKHLFVRRDVWSLEASNPWDAVTTGYAKAVAEMRRRPADDPTSWDYQIALHATRADTPPGADWNYCQHESWFLLPWHRMYTYFFEQIARKVVVSQGGPKDWALPYWNYSAGGQASTLPPAFRLPTWNVDGTDQPNPLYTSHRAPGINDGAALPPNLVSFEGAFSFTNFTDLPAPGFGGGRAPATQFSRFPGALDGVPHGTVHGLVGGPTGGDCEQGWMSDPYCSPRDPVFWVHHTNIDRLWVNWLARGGGRANPTDRVWLKTRFPFYDENGARVTMTAADILDTVKQLHYKYDDGLPPVTASLRDVIAVNTPPPSLPQGPPRLIAASEEGMTLSGQPTSVTVPLPAAAQNTVATLVAGDSSGHLTLSVEGIQFVENPGVVYEVHLNLPPGGDPITNDTFFAGIISFFSSGRHEPGQKPDADPVGINHAFDITGLVQMLHAQDHWDAQQATITFIPVGLIPPGGTPESAYDVEPATTPHVARVSLSFTP
jgi:tyrosinase-like protein/polyphenol oxidase-like protein